MINPLVLTLAMAAGAMSIQAQEVTRLPIIDMHAHATTADGEGPPPLGICGPFYPQTARS